MAYIFISKPDGSKNKYRLPNNESTRVDIGRGEDCLISLPDVIGVSGLHCSISYTQGYYTIKDENSSNGTIVDGRSITQEALYEDKSYHIGEGILTFFGEGAIAPAPKEEATPSTAFASADGKISGNTPLPERKYASTDKTSAADKFFPIYIVIICVISFLAGITLRHWTETGKYDPMPFAQEGQAAAPAASKPTPAAAAKAAVKPEAKPAEPAPAAAPAEPATTEADPAANVEEELSAEEGSL